jgi:DNA-directed RNA polymerase subunit RPC12/RpoP
MADATTLEWLEKAVEFINSINGGDRECPYLNEMEQHLESMKVLSTANWYPVCAKCGSGNLEIQAYVEWNPDENDWEVSQEFEDYTCLDCGDKGDHYDTETIDRNKDSEND